MHTYTVSLRIESRELDTAQITKELTISPTQTRAVGERRDARTVWDKALWEFQVVPEGRSRLGFARNWAGDTSECFLIAHKSPSGVRQEPRRLRMVWTLLFQFRWRPALVGGNSHKVGRVRNSPMARYVFFIGVVKGTFPVCAFNQEYALQRKL
jgi:hypothetical protein